MTSHNTQLEAQVRAATSSAGFIGRGGMVGRLRASGKDVLDLLNRLSTNKLDAMQPGQVAHTVLTTNKGRIVDALTVAHLGESFLMLTSYEARAAVLEWLDKYTFTEDAKFTDVTEETMQLTVTGPRAQDLVKASVGADLAELAPQFCRAGTWNNYPMTVLRTDALGAPTFEIITVSTAQMEGAKLALRMVRASAPLGAVPLRPEAWEVLRIRAGVPAHGRELTDAYNPLEAGLQYAISWNKGCYIGQEVVARLNTYHKVQRHLVRMELEGTEPPPAGSKLLVGGKDAGVFTSAALDPTNRHIVALGYLRTAYVKEGPGLAVTAVTPDGKPTRGRVVWAPTLPAEAVTPAQLLALAEEDSAN
jgi:folate-binding protein YgfZ